MTDPDCGAARLRKAVACGAYLEADALARAYCANLERRVGELPPEDPGRGRLLAEAVQLLEWARRAAGADRAHAALELSRLAASREYHAPPAAKSPCWIMEA